MAEKRRARQSTKATRATPASRARARKAARPVLAEADRLEGDEALLAALLRGASLAAAAAEAGVSERTARRRVHEQAFRERLDAGRAEVTAIVAAQLAGGSELGYGVLVELAGDANVTAAVRRKAAADLIEFATQVGAARNVEARLEALELQLERLGSP